MSIWFTLGSFRQLCFDLATSARWSEDEPIPEFDTRFPGRLESCVETPRQTFEGRPLYPTLIDQAAILFYFLNKNHPFENGNKRIALTALLVFLFLNGKWLVAETQELYEFAIGVAASDAREKDRVVEETKEFLETHLKDIDGHSNPNPIANGYVNR